MVEQGAVSRRASGSQPSELVLFGGKTWAQQERQMPHCPECGRAYAEKFYEPRAGVASFRCVGVPVNPGCGNVWRLR